jgi:Fur family ferric uptake transcriptional regulator
VVLEALVEAEDAQLTAEDLAAEVHASHPRLNESTVYRTLELLEELGVVSHVHLGHGPSHWYLSHGRQRWYLTCTGCGRVSVADPDLLSSLTSELERRSGFVVDSGHFAITGLCRACRRRAQPRSRRAGR